MEILPSFEIVYLSTINPESTTSVSTTPVIPSTSSEPSQNDHSSNINLSSQSPTFESYEINPSSLPPINEQISILYPNFSNSNDLEELFPSGL